MGAPGQSTSDDPGRRVRDVEWAILRYRTAAAIFFAVQTGIAPGDDTRLSWLLVAAFVASLGVGRLALTRASSPSVVRRIGAGTMVFDVVTVVAVLANNLTDPAEPVYMVTILLVLEAAIRWSFAGGAVGGLVGGTTAAVWTVTVHDRIGTALDVSYASIRFGTIAVLGLFIGFILGRLDRERGRLQQTLDASPDLIVRVDRGGTVVEVNGASTGLIGRDPAEVVGRTVCELVHPDDVVLAGTAAEEALAGTATVSVELRLLHADGVPRWFELNVSAVAGEEVLHAVARDVTERRQAARQVAISEQRFRSLFDHSTDAVYSYDLQGRFTSANPAAQRLTGYSFEELRDIGFGPLVEPNPSEVVLERFEQVRSGESLGYDLVVRARDGRLVDLEVTTVPMIVDGEVVGVYGVAKDVTERRQLERDLGYQARHDALTGLPNRLGLDELLASLADDRRSPGDGVGMVFVDLDRFKTVNDSLGHRYGDELLVAAAGRLQSCLRAGDTLVRWAGDEFCAVLPGVDRPDPAMGVAGRMLEALGEPFEVGGQAVHLSASIGVATSADASEAERVLQHADDAMYEAKASGRGRIVLRAERSEVPGRSALALEAALRGAIERDELQFVHQPIVAVATGRIVGVECLARWPLSADELLLPADFIPLAEESGLIRPLTRWAVGRACQQLAEWDATAGTGEGEPLGVHVNIGAADLRDAALVDEVAAILDRTGLAPHRLVLEMTEGTLVQQPAVVAHNARGLRRLGVRLGVDDFGTGYSSLRQLRQLPVTAVKIDCSFFRDLSPGSDDVEVLASMLAIGRAFGVEVVAAGVERREQLAALVEAGCAHAQGHAIVPPVAAVDLLPRLRSRSVAPTWS